LSEQVSAALAHAHAHDVIHRDVKTSNILLDDEGNALLSDFGFALWKEASIRLTGSALIGTPAYMSPEQCLGEPVDVRSDQYSFAVVLYRIATGRLPFEGDTPLALAMKHIQQPLPPPRSINPKLPEGVEAVLLKALAKEPEHRFKDMNEFDAAFQAALTGVLDPAMVRTPQPMHFNIPTEVRLQQENDSSFFGYLGRSRVFRKPVLVGLISVLLMLPIGALAMRELGYSIFFQPVSIAPDYQATIDALYTANAPQPGAEFSPKQIEAAVMGTLSALVESDGVDVDTVVVEEGGTFNIMGGGSPTSTLTLSPVPIPSTSRTPTPRDGDEQSSQDVRSTPIPPSETSSASPTVTPSAETTSAPTVTQTLESTDTPVPPTSTPLGICKTKPHPVFPTCTPAP
jgi:serine/threonine protein kinase